MASLLGSNSQSVKLKQTNDEMKGIILILETRICFHQHNLNWKVSFFFHFSMCTYSCVSPNSFPSDCFAVYIKFTFNKLKVQKLTENTNHWIFQDQPSQPPCSTILTSYQWHPIIASSTVTSNQGELVTTIKYPNSSLISIKR